MNLQPKQLRLCLAALFFLSGTGLVQAAIIYVNPTAAGANNGTSWLHAYTSLSSALAAAAPGDEIWVKQGVYKPATLVDLNGSGGTDAREATFQVPEGVAVYGGFNGTEATRSARNPEANRTILSGDIDNNDSNADGNFIAETTAAIVGANAYHVLYTRNVGAATRVDGMYITAGFAESADPVTDPNQDGGGWYNGLAAPAHASSPTLVNVTFQGNYAASEGGALYNTNAPAGGAVLSQIRDCRFLYNKSNGAGGAITLGSFSAGNYQPHLVRCQFVGNEAYRRGGAISLVGDHAIIDSSHFRSNKVTAISMDGTFPGSGGGVAMTASNALFKGCQFIGNETTGNPTGAFEGGGGGAVYMSTTEGQTTSLGASEPGFTGCGFYGNQARNNGSAWGGAAVHLSDGGQLRPRYANCVFAGNEAQNDGGAIANFARVIIVEDGFVPVLAPAFTNCTFTANNAGSRGGALYNDGYVYNGTEMLQSRVENTILWNNTAAGGGPEIYNNAINVVAYSLVRGSGGSGAGWNSTVGSDGGNNLDGDPVFVHAGDPDGADNVPATADDGLRLAGTSPAADAGNNAAAGLAGITTDYTGAARLQGSRVDMGAYERTRLNLPRVEIYWLREWRIPRPQCLSCPWAFLLADRTLQQFVWDGPAQLADKGETAIVTGRIVHPRDKSLGFEVYLELTNKQDWAAWSRQGRTYAAYTLEAALVARQAHGNWMFWELSGASYLKGTGALSGTIRLAHAPDNRRIGFQLGTGANGWDGDLGLSGIFSYEGTITYREKRLRLSGIGSMNVDAEACTANCNALPGAELTRVQPGLNQKVALEGAKAGFSLYPVPARHSLTIVTNGLPAGLYTVRIYTGMGQLKKADVLVLGAGSAAFPLNGLPPGNYVLELVSPSGARSSRKLLVR